MSHRARLWVIGFAGLAMAALAGVLTATSHHAQLRGLNASLGALVGLAFIGTGLFAWARRPDNTVGMLMVATGFAWSAVGLSQANAPLLFTIGMAIGPLYLVFLSWLLLAFPDGRVESPLAHRLLIAGFIDVLIIYELGILLDIDTSDMGDVPNNVFAIAHAPGVASAFDTASAAIGAIVIASVTALVVERRVMQDRADALAVSLHERHAAVRQIHGPTVEIEPARGRPCAIRQAQRRIAERLGQRVAQGSARAERGEDVADGPRPRVAAAQHSAQVGERQREEREQRDRLGDAVRHVREAGGPDREARRDRGQADQARPQHRRRRAPDDG